MKKIYSIATAILLIYKLEEDGTQSTLRINIKKNIDFSGISG